MRFLGFVGSFIAILAGCSSAAETPSTEETAAVSSEALTKCGLPPKLVCNVPRCTADGWVMWPTAKGGACTVNGLAGKCDGGRIGPPGQIDPDEIGKCVASTVGSIAPKFFVLSVVYAPPGTAGTASKSSVAYTTGSAAGTETKVSHAFKAGVTEQAEASIAGFATLDVSSGYSLSTASDSSLAIKKSSSLSIADQGPNIDGIDHDSDLIYLWLNPLVAIAGNGSSLNWTVASNGPTMDIQYVSVGQLKHPSTLPPGVLARFAAYGITQSDYATILGRDPFAYGATAIDANRYVRTWTTIPYEPPIAAGQEPPHTTLTISNETTSTHTSSYTGEYSVGYSLKTGSPSFTSWLGAGITTTGTFTWTDSGSSTSNTTSSDSASVTMTGPSFGYTGPTDMAVYYDTLYRTFLFAPITGAVRIVGGVRDTSGKAVAGSEVVVTTAKGRFRTVTDSQGEYRIYDAGLGAATVTVAGVSSRAVVLATSPIQHDVVLAAMPAR